MPCRKNVVAGLGWLALILVSLVLLRFAWNGLTAFSTRLDAPLSPGATGTPLTNRLLIILLDGLRADTAAGMPELQKIAARGAQGVAIAGVPSYSKATMASIVTGAYHDVHGIATNHQKGPLRVDNIFALARERGITTAMVQDNSGVKLYTQFLDIPAYTRYSEYEESADDDVVGKAKQVIADSKDKPLLLWVHFSAIDHAGHQHGGNSPQYLQVAANTDNRLAQVVKAWFDASPDATVIVTADHGHRLEGGHGGDENEVCQVPLVLAGKGIKPGSIAAQSQRAIATTASLLLGMRFPAHSEDHFLLPAIDASPELLLARSRDFLQQQVVWNQAFGERLGIALAPHTPKEPGDVATLWALFAQVEGWREQVRAAYWQQARTGRLLPTLAVALAWLVLLLLPLWYRQRGVTVSFLALVLFQAGLWGVWKLQTEPVSISLITMNSLFAPLFLKRAGEALLLAILISALLAACFARRCGGATVVVRRALLGMAAGAFGVGLVFYWQYGLSSSLLPPINAAFHAYMAMLHCVVLGLCGIAVSLLPAPKAGKTSS